MCHTNNAKWLNEVINTSPVFAVTAIKSIFGDQSIKSITNDDCFSSVCRNDVAPGIVLGNRDSMISVLQTNWYKIKHNVLAKSAVCKYFTAIDHYDALLTLHDDNICEMCFSMLRTSCLEHTTENC